MKRINLLLAVVSGLLIGEAYLLLASIRFDFGTYYHAAQVLRAGADPYVDFNYRQLPLWAWLLQPLGALPWSWASPLWLLLSLVALVIGTLLTFRAFALPLDRVRLLWVAVFLASPPTMLCLYYGQATPFVLLGYAGALYLAKRGRFGLAGLALALAMIKPHLSLICLPLLLALPYAAWAAFAAGAVLWLGLSGALGGPTLLLAFAQRITSLSVAPTFEERPTIFGLIGPFVPQPATVNGILTAALLLLVLWLGIARLLGLPFPLRPNKMTVLSALLLPYILTNDLILLMPVYVATVAAGPLPASWRFANLLLLVTLPLLTVLFVGRGGGNSVDAFILLALLFTMHRQGRRVSGEAPISSALVNPLPTTTLAGARLKLPNTAGQAGR